VTWATDILTWPLGLVHCRLRAQTVCKSWRRTLAELPVPYLVLQKNDRQVRVLDWVVKARPAVEHLYVSDYESGQLGQVVQSIRPEVKLAHTGSSVFS
jgi:hypothetical protein